MELMVETQQLFSIKNAKNTVFSDSFSSSQNGDNKQIIYCKNIFLSSKFYHNFVPKWIKQENKLVQNI